jgi:hypothetical protein
MRQAPAFLLLQAALLACGDEAADAAKTAAAAARVAAGNKASNSTDFFGNCVVKTGSVCELWKSNTTNTTTGQRMSCDLAPVLLKVLELKEKVGEIEEQLVEVIAAAVNLTKVVKLGGAASGLGLAIFLVYLVIMAIVAIVNYSKNKQTEHADAKDKAINRAARQAAKKLYKRSAQGESRGSRENLSIM